MPGIGDILGGKTGQLVDIFLYAVFGQVANALLSPYLVALSQDVWEKNPLLTLTPSQLGQLVERGYMDESTAAAEAEKSGIDAERFSLLWRGMRLPIAPQQAAEALRRKFIPEDSGDPNVPSFQNAIRQGDLGNQWADVIKLLATALPSPISAVEASVTNQLTDAEARDAYQAFGGDPAWYDLLFHLYGTPPTPNEAGVLANRGIISWTGTGPDSTSFEQVFHESHFKDKYLEAYKQLQVYLPPPRTVTAMLRNGSFTDAEALALFEKTGLPPDLAQAYVADAHHQKNAANKDLAQATIVALYEDQLIDSSKATDMLKLLGYDDTEAAFILAIEDTKIEQSMIHAAINRVQTLYINRKIRDNDAINSLNSLGLGADQVNRLITIWKLERANNIKVLTQAEIAAAFGNKILTQDEAIAELVAIGYTAYDGWILLSNHVKQALPNMPSKVPTPIEDITIT